MSALKSLWIAAASFAAVAAVSAKAPAQDAQPPAPALRIESPFAAPIWRLAVDAGETKLVSSSADKAVTVWPLDFPEGRRIARVPLRPEQRKRAHPVAVSPDGALVAYGVPPLAEEDGAPKAGTARIYLMQVADGAILQIIEGVATRPQALAFSPDGAYLAAALSSGCGVRVWSKESWSQAFADNPPAVEPSQSCGAPGGADAVEKRPNTLDLAFVPSAADGQGLRLIASGEWGVRAYVQANGEFRPYAAVEPDEIALDRPEGLALNPDGTAVAVGDGRRRMSEDENADAASALAKAVELRVAILDVATLKPLRDPLAITRDSSALFSGGYLDPKQVPAARLFNLPRVAWVADGEEEWIFAGGFFGCEAARPDLRLQRLSTRQDLCLIRWSAKRQNEEPRFIATGTDRIMDLRALPKNRALGIATKNSVEVLDFSGEPAALESGATLSARNLSADFRDGARPFSISSDAKTIYFEDYQSRQDAPLALRFSVEKLLVETTDGAGLIAPDQDANLLRSQGDPNGRWWRDTRGPAVFRGEKPTDARFSAKDVFRSVALLPGRALAVLGSADALRVLDFGDGGPRIKCERAVSEEAYRVNVTPDGSIVVAGHSDGVLRWYRNVDLGDGTCRLDLLLSLYLSRTEAGDWTWVAWLPSGEFANDPRAQDALVWQITDASGAVKTVKFFENGRWYRRDKVAGALAALNAPREIQPAAVEPAIAPDLHAGIVAVAAKRVLQISPSAPRAVGKERFRYRLLVASEGSWPKRLTAKTGDGLKAPILLDGQNEPAEDSGALVSGKKGEDLEFDMILPEPARAVRRAMDLCFFLNDVRQVCGVIQWTGPPPPRRPRRLWAIIAGFSQYDALPKLDFAQNDAMDLARLLIKDFERWEPGAELADFAQINIDLLVSASTPQAEKEVAELAASPLVTLRPASRDGLMAALNSIAQREADGASTNDLFFFFFAGHGFANPFAGDTGFTALATPSAPREATKENFKAHALISDQLIAALDKIGAQKFIVLDACRVRPEAQSYTPMSSTQLTNEFAAGAIASYFYFASDEGQVSLEQPDFFFDKSRPEASRGNGLFGFAFLQAMTSKDADLAGRTSGRGKIDTDEMMRFMESRIFDPDNEQSIVRRLRETRDKSVSQWPRYLPARRINGGESSHYLDWRSLDQ